MAGNPAPGQAAPQKRPKSADRRTTIGFLAANIHVGAARNVWIGIVDAAIKHDVNLICFPGGRLRATAGHEARRNAVYDLAQVDHLEGLVSWSSTMAGTLTRRQLLDFHRRFEPLPVVNLAQPLEGIPTVLIDSYDGMRSLVVHLTEVHRYRRLAFVRGPEGHFYAQERYRAYLDVLQERAIRFDPGLVTPPVHWEFGAEAMRVLLDERGLRPGTDFDAVVAVSDLLALDVLRTLQGRGVRVPGQVAVVGFNDSTEGQLTMPPLTSVALPFYEQGERAVEMLLASLAGKEVPDLVTLRSRLMVRQSCGCPSRPIALARSDSTPGRTLPLPDLVTCQSQIVGEIVTGMDASSVIASRIDEVLTAFFADLGDLTSELFLPALEKVLRWAMETRAEVAAWHTVVSILRRNALPHLPAPMQARAEDLFGQARVLIGDAAQRVQAYAKWQAERQSESLRQISQALITTFDVDKLADVLAERLPRLGMDSCYLALYKDATSALDQAALVLGYTEHGRMIIDPAGLRFPSRSLAPDGSLPSGRRFSFIVEPLYFEDEQIGFGLFEIGPRDGIVYEVLRGAISSALKGALLFRAALEAQAAAEKADRIKTRLLANVSHEMRTPLNIILDRTREALSAPNPYGMIPPAALLSDLGHIQHSAEHQLRVINDLLDLSRAEIDELDLCLELFDPHPLLEESFCSLADRADPEGRVSWQLRLPDRLPIIQADRVRLRQVLLNLLHNAKKYTEEGQITLGAQVSPPHLHLWVQDTGPGISPDQQERIFEPFVTAERDHRRRGGVGLGLAITRRLVALHNGTMTLESQPREGSTFHVYLPLPSLSEPAPRFQQPSHPVLLLVSDSDRPSAEIVGFSQRQGIEIRTLRAGDDLDLVLAEVEPTVVAWDMSGAGPGDWAVVRHLQNHPRLCRSPFILYGPAPSTDASLTAGVTSFTTKPVPDRTLLDLINAAAPSVSAGPILIVDDNARDRDLYLEIVSRGVPGCRVLTASDAEGALAVMDQETPSLAILDLMMPGMDGFDLLDRLRSDPRTRQVPVVILSGRLLSFEDVKRLEQHALVTFQSKGILSETEIVSALHRALFGDSALPRQTSALVKRAVAYLHQNYGRPLVRWEISEAVGASEDYLSRVFHRELGLSPWDYLNRYRVEQARQLLRHTTGTIREIARYVGFKDQFYFSRVFRRLAGVSPSGYREHPEP